MDKILIIEDERRIARFLELELRHQGYEVMIAYDGKMGLEMALEEDVALVILDLMLPGMDGMEVCRQVRKSGSKLPIIMLTAKDDVMDKVRGLDIGADDYMTKPFAIEELFARMRVALKRTHEKEEVSELTTGKLHMDLLSRTVRYEETEITLTKKEYELLEYLMLHKNVAITRQELIHQVWKYEYLGDTNVVDVYIRYLRHKIDDQFEVPVIHTIRGVGYMIKDE